jgi:hypothetical protein
MEGLPAGVCPARRDTMKKKLMLFTALVACVALTGCYTTRRLAGDKMVGGVTNPAIWFTGPIDAVMSLYQIPMWALDENDDWTPFDPDEIRGHYDYSHLWSHQGM